jgi:hypothetical protein
MFNIKRLEMKGWGNTIKNVIEIELDRVPQPGVSSMLYPQPGTQQRFSIQVLISVSV